ncbi:MAG TPA: hypothetical protein VLG27_03440 [Candidatus Saccharimonadia bacterium]|nr:hypothetical protein [Candidatus Saccharimonadia bacterium]
MSETIFRKVNPDVRRRAAVLGAAGSIAVPAVAVATTVEPKREVRHAQAPATGTLPSSSPSTNSLAWQTKGPKHPDKLLKKLPRYSNLSFTGYEVKGQTSTFGPPTDGVGPTADQRSNTGDACIAIRNDSTLDHKFLLTILYNHRKYQDITYQCDYGPGITWRAIDVTGAEVKQVLHMDANNYPTDHAYGIAQEIRGPKVQP